MSNKDAPRTSRRLDGIVESLVAGAIAVLIVLIGTYAGASPSAWLIALAGASGGGLTRTFRDRIDGHVRIDLPPTFWVDRIARFFWSKKTYERVFAPVKADLVHEWMEAEAAGQRRKAWFICWVRGPFTQLSHMAAQVPFSIAKRVIEMFEASK